MDDGILGNLPGILIILEVYIGRRRDVRAAVSRGCAILLVSTKGGTSVKKHSRILWAMALCMLTMTVLIGYTAARGDLPPSWIISPSQTFRPVQIVKQDVPEAESEPDKAPRQASALHLYHHSWHYRPVRPLSLSCGHSAHLRYKRAYNRCDEHLRRRGDGVNPSAHPQTCRCGARAV